MVLAQSIDRNDILRKHGVIPEKPPSPTPIIQEAILKAREEAHENRLQDKSLEELRDLEEEEDDAFLEKYRWICPWPRNGVHTEKHLKAATIRGALRNLQN